MQPGQYQLLTTVLICVVYVILRWRDERKRDKRNAELEARGLKPDGTPIDWRDDEPL